jgi:trk system potassium uptake protein TrkH
VVAVTVRVDWRASVALVGTVVKYLAATMALPLGIAIVYGEDALVFGISMAIVAAVALALERLDDDPDLGAREALLFVSLSWLAAAVVGTVPYLLAGYGTASTLSNPVNALFESMSGFTTTGATVMGAIGTDHHSHAIMLWRQLTQWLGGMGIIVLMIAILPELAVNGARVNQSEAPGRERQKLRPKIVETARTLWLVYLGFTLLYIAVMHTLQVVGWAPNMTLYNAVAHGLSTMPTGGFSTEARSMAAFRPVVQWVAIPFLVAGGVDVALFWQVLHGEWRTLLEDREFRAYTGAIAVFVAVLSAVLFLGGAPTVDPGGTTAGNAENALLQGAFQIASLLNSTGFATSDFAAWDAHARAVVLFAMLVGGSVGSTGGGVKVVRWLVVIKTVRRELSTTANPDTVTPVRLAGRVVDEDAIRAILAFSALYFLLLVVATVFLAVDAARVGYQVTVLEAFSAALATIGNIGPGFGSVGPFGSYVQFPASSKLVMVVLMWVGRLEIVPVLALVVGGVERG